MMNYVRVVLPESYDLVVGDTFQLFYRGIIEAVNPYCYDILAVCEKGKNYPRYFEFLPEEEGEYLLTITVYDNEKVLLDSAQTRLQVFKAKDAPKKKVNILCIGDSLTSSGMWVQEAFRRLTATDGIPCGHGFSGFQFIGSVKNEVVGWEGYGGWSWDTYLTFTYERAAVWIYCEHDKTVNDQHSLWIDENDNLWQLETIESARLKFNRKRYGDPKPEPGQILCHFKNAENTASISVEGSIYESLNPFWNEKQGELDFKDYCDRHHFDGIDAVYIMLTWNGQRADRPPIEEYCQGLVQKGKEFVTRLHNQYPSAQIKIMGLQVPSVNGGTGANYGAVLPYCDDYDLTRFVFELNRAYESWTKEEAYRDFAEFINISGQFDSENNMPYMEKHVNTRSNIVEKIGTNGLHPLPEGFLQIADAVYRNMVKCFCR